jgi:hypothetical protein
MSKLIRITEYDSEEERAEYLNMMNSTNLARNAPG